MVKYWRIPSYIRKPLLIHIWLCNRSHLNFHIYEYEENFVLFLSVHIVTKIVSKPKIPCYWPGSLMWTWLSTTPGMRTRSPISSTLKQEHWWNNFAFSTWTCKKSEVSAVLEGGRNRRQSCTTSEDRFMSVDVRVDIPEGGLGVVCPVPEGGF